MLLFAFKVNAQEHSSKKYINEISQMYSTKLDLTKSQSKKIKKFLRKYNILLEEIDDRKTFNKIVKMQTLEISKLVSKEQYTKFKKVILELEPFKNYKL